jgi:GNAT superfamily N-acetyltransferase
VTRRPGRLHARGTIPCVSSFATRALDAGTFEDFARLADEHDGVWGGCYCLGFHAEGAERSSRRRGIKEELVRDGRAHAALVYDGEQCIGWCQFGPPQELPRIKRKRAYDAGEPQPPDWRITCFFVHREHRGRGVAAAALAGALAEIARLGGGTVESFPEDADGRRTSAGFLHNATTSVFERHGFTRVRPLGKHHWLVTRTVDPLTPSAGREAAAG